MFNIATQPGQGTGRELISFRLGGQDYCVDIMAVREIRGWTPSTSLPHAPGHVQGVVNLRGAVLPILDLGRQLGFPPAQPSKQHVIIVVQVGTHICGLLVDGVNDILTVPEAAIQPPPEVASSMSHGLVEGLIAEEGRMLTVLSLERLIPLPVQQAA